MEVTAKLKFYRQSPRKVRLVTNLIRYMDVQKALNQLGFLNKRAALPIKKLLASGLANAVNNFSLNEKNLYVKKIVVDGGPSLKRWMPRAFGRASKIRKRTSHVTLVLDEKITTKKPESLPKNEQKQSTGEVAQVPKGATMIKATPPITSKRVPKKTRGIQKTIQGFAPKIFQRKVG